MASPHTLHRLRPSPAVRAAQVTAKAKEVETEEHLRELSRREAGRLRTDAGRLRRRQGQLAERVAGMQRDALAAAERVDQFRLAMSFNQVGRQYEGPQAVLWGQPALSCGCG